MERLLFTPFAIVAGLIAGFAGRIAFERVWSLIDDQEPPEPEHREVSMPKLIIASVLQGAIFTAVRSLAEHGARRAFQRWTGAWPGEPRPEAE